MYPYIEDTKPVRSRLRIGNKRRLIIFLLLLLFTLLSIFIPKKGTSQEKYREYQVGYKETYWSIAKRLQEAGYKPRADIRNIVTELTEASDIPAHELQAGDTILIPEVYCYE